MYSGIPYTQNEQVDEIAFLDALNKSNFYATYEKDGVKMPRYGNDCSEFVYNRLGAYKLVYPEYAVWAEDYDEDSVQTVSAGGNFARVKREDLIYPKP